MKKVLFLMLTAVAAVALTVSCTKDKKDDGGKDAKTYRLVKYVDAYAGTFDYAYGADGKVSTITRVETYDGETYNTVYSFNYKDAKNLEIKEGDATKYTVELNDKGHATKFADQWDTYIISYDANGHMTKVERDGGVFSEITWSNGNITKWTKKEGDGFVEKLHSYGTDKNVGKIHNIFSEKCGIPRWLMETGLGGAATDYLCTGNGWGDPSLSSYEYEANDDGYVTKEIKKGADYEEVGLYTWEEIK